MCEFFVLKIFIDMHSPILPLFAFPWIWIWGSGGQFNSINSAQLKFNWQWKWILSQNSIPLSNGSYWLNFRFKDSSSFDSLKLTLAIFNPPNSMLITFLITFGCSPFGRYSLLAYFIADVKNQHQVWICIFHYSCLQSIDIITCLKNDDCNSTRKKNLPQKKSLNRMENGMLTIAIFNIRVLLFWH